MWVKVHARNVINLDNFRTIHLENGVLLARNGREYQVLSKGDETSGSAKLRLLVDSLAMGLNFLDLS
jgi:hypothetical protein